VPASWPQIVEADEGCVDPGGFRINGAGRNFIAGADIGEAGIPARGREAVAPMTCSASGKKKKGLSQKPAWWSPRFTGGRARFGDWRRKKRALRRRLSDAPGRDVQDSDSPEVEKLGPAARFRSGHAETAAHCRRAGGGTMMIPEKFSENRCEGHSHSGSWWTEQRGSPGAFAGQSALEDVSLHGA